MSIDGKSPALYQATSIIQQSYITVNIIFPSLGNVFLLVTHNKTDHAYRQLRPMHHLDHITRTGSSVNSTSLSAEG
jgi:hypothetical protein